MDLALHFGTPVESLRRSMTERELIWWADYRRKHWLPLQRIEWYLARLTLYVALTMGRAEDKTVDDFLLKLEPKTDDGPDEADMESMFGGAR